MDNFITTADYDATIHREILDALLRKDTATYDPQIVEICEDRAISQMRSYLSKRYDCEKIFSAQGGDRHPEILMFAVDIAVYHIFCQHNPYKIAQIRKDRYDRAMVWLKDVAKNTINIAGAPMLAEDDLQANSQWQIHSEDIRPTLL